MRNPALVVFDLDFTLWDCGGTWCDCLAPPFRKRAGNIEDRHGRAVQLYNDVLAILDFCDQASIPMALASRTQQPNWARELVAMLGLSHRFEFTEIYPSTKRQHFAALRKISGIDYAKMLFFDDEMRNIKEVSSLGVTCVHVNDGLSHVLFQRGLALAHGRL